MTNYAASQDINLSNNQIQQIELDMATDYV
jgi:hypothetical protein